MQYYESKSIWTANDSTTNVATTIIAATADTNTNGKKLKEEEEKKIISVIFDKRGNKLRIVCRLDEKISNIIDMYSLKASEYKNSLKFIFLKKK